MTEQQWWASTELWPMLEFLKDRASVRKLRLFSVACCRRALPWMTDSRQRDVVFATERLADGLATEAEFEVIHNATLPIWHGLPDKRQAWTLEHYLGAGVFQLGNGSGAGYAASYVARGLAGMARPEQSTEWHEARQREEAEQCSMLREIIGSPFRPFFFDSTWLAHEGRTAVFWAQQQYERGECESLVPLADLFERSGCCDAQVLAHCRQSEPHVRGCWVLDALMGQEPAVRVGLVTDADWQQCADPEPMLHFLRDKGSARQWRQFAVGACRRIDHLITDQRSRWAIDIAARHADGLATDAELAAAWSGAEEARKEAASEEYKTEAEEQFCTTSRYAASACRVCSAAAASSAACRDPRVSDNENGSYDAEHWRPSHHWASAAIRYDSIARREIRYGDADSNEAFRLADEDEFEEWRAQCAMLRHLFADWFGPVGEECDWLPNGFLRKASWSSNAVQWCRLPITRTS